MGRTGIKGTRQQDIKEGLNTLERRKLKVNDFFCGCGGMGLAFMAAGFEIAGAWDYDKHAIKSYRENVGNAAEADIKNLHHEDMPVADVWAFGFPCQDLSVAGKQKGLVLQCQECGEELEIDPEKYTEGGTFCPRCGSQNMKAASRSGMFFEMMRLLDETIKEAPAEVPAVIIAENVKGLRPYLQVLQEEYKKRGYTAHIETFNSKWWGVPQSRERYAVVGTLDRMGIEFQFPEEQHKTIPRLSDFLDEDVDEKYFIADEKAKEIIKQATEKVGELGHCHHCITPDRVNKRQNGRRAKGDEEPMFTLTAKDIHGVIVERQTEDLPKCKVVGILTNSGTTQEHNNRVYSVDGISPTLTAVSGGTHHIKIYDPSRHRVRKLTPTEYGRPQAFPMNKWKSVVSDSQTYKQFGNAVTVTVFEAVAENIAAAIQKKEDLTMDFSEAMNATAEADAMHTETATAEQDAGQEKKTAIEVPELTEKILNHLAEKGFLPGFVFDVANASLIEYAINELEGLYIGAEPENKRDWEAAEKAVKAAETGIRELRERLENGERTPDLFNAIVAVTR